MIAETAPAKVNLLLHVGPRRRDGLHDLCSIFASLELADVVAIEESRTGEDVVLCPGVAPPNLVDSAIAALRSASESELPPLRVTIDKRIPVAAGLGGGSADAAAVLRGANALLRSPHEAAALRRIAATIGADVPSQVEPDHALVTGAGENVEPVVLPPMALVLLPQQPGLLAREVYAEADRLGAIRPLLDPGLVRGIAASPLQALATGLESDLQAAVLSLRPSVAARIEALRQGGALAALVTGSGPTVFGVFARRGEAERAAALTSGALVTMVRASARRGRA